MRVGDVMTTEVLTVTGDESLKAAARLMVEAGVSGLPVIDDGGSLIGIITEADFVRRQARRIGAACSTSSCSVVTRYPAPPRWVR